MPGEDEYPSYPPITDPWSYISQEDRASMDGLPLSELQRRTREKIDRHREYVLALSTIHNAAAPIHALLPPELLIHTFTLLPVEDLRDARLMLVCRRWRDLLLRTPEFWANLLTVIRMSYHNMRDEFLQTTLQRSYPCNLSLKVNVKFLQKPEFTSHLGRISALRLDVIVGWYEQLHELLMSGQLPVLESLAIELFTADGQKLSDLCQRLSPCTDDSLPRLRSANVPGEIFAFLLSVSQLRTLTLCRLEYLHGFDAPNYTPNLISAIRRCTNLRALRVEALPNSGWEEIAKPPAESTPFPNLRMLEIVLTHDHSPLANVLQHLVRHVVPPHGARIQLIAGRAGAPVSILMPAYPLAAEHEGKPLIHVDVSGIGPLALTVRVNNHELVEVKVTPPQQEVNIPASEPLTASLTRYMRFLMQYFVFMQGIDTLNFYYGFNHSVTREDLTVILELLPSLKSLTLHGWLPSRSDCSEAGDESETPQDLLGALCNASQSDGDILCPALQKLEFICEGPMPAGKVMAARFATVMSARQSMSAARLDSFTFHEYPRTAAEASADDIHEELLDVVRPFVDTFTFIGAVKMDEDA